MLAVAIGAPFAVAVAMTDLPSRRALGFLLLLPPIIAPQVTALSWLHLNGPSSTFLNMLGIALPPGTPNPILGRSGIVLLYGVQHAPIVFITLRAGLVGLPSDLIEAARASGAGSLRAFPTVVLPLMRPWIAAAAALAFVSGIGNFGIPAFRRAQPPAASECRGTALRTARHRAGDCLHPPVPATAAAGR